MTYRIHSRSPADAETIHSLTPGSNGVNTFVELHTAGGVCHDIRKHLVDGTAGLVDGKGARVPDEAWMPRLLLTRGR